MYAGPLPWKIKAAADKLRDGDIGDGITISEASNTLLGADKLAHCYAFCTGTAWFYSPGLTYAALSTGIAGDFLTDVADDVEANLAGFELGRTKGLAKIASPIAWLGFPYLVKKCTKQCAVATYHMKFEQ